MERRVDPFVALAECSDGVVLVFDRAMRMLYASSSLERETGFTADDFQFPQEDNPFVHREDAERVARNLSDFLASDAQTSAPIDNRVLDRWGRTHSYRTVINKISYANADALMFVCRPLASPAKDVDDRQYRALVESADDAIVRLDNAGRFLFANRRTHELLGYSVVELGRLRLDDVVASAHRDVFSRALAQSVGSPHPVRCEIQLVSKQGDKLCVQAVLRSLAHFGQPGELLAILHFKL